MFNAGVVIAELSGHKSAKALQKYEHTSPSLLNVKVHYNYSLSTLTSDFIINAWFWLL